MSCGWSGVDDVWGESGARRLILDQKVDWATGGFGGFTLCFTSLTADGTLNIWVWDERVFGDTSEQQEINSEAPWELELLH